MSLNLAHIVQADMSRLQQTIRDFFNQQKSHLKMHQSMAPGSLGNDPAHWLEIVTQTKMSVMSLRQEMTFLVNRLPPTAPLDVRSNVNGTKAAIDRDLRELDALAQSK